MERKTKKGESSKCHHSEHGLVDMTVTEDNPIIITRRGESPDPVPVQRTQSSTELMISQLHDSVSTAMVSRNQSQQLMVAPTEAQSTSQQLTPVDIGGGEFHGTHFGPMNTSMTATKNVGIAGGDLRGAHIGPSNYYNITVSKDPPETKRRKVVPKAAAGGEKTRDETESDWSSSLTKTLKQLWSGEIKDQQGTTVLPCQFYQSLNSRDNTGISGADWIFEISTIQHLNIGTLKKVTDDPPTGYIVTSASDELKNLTEKLAKNKLMSWIDIVPPKEECNPLVLVLLCQQGYPELFGLLLPDSEILTSLIKGIVSKRRPTRPKCAAKAVNTAVASTSSNIPRLIAPGLLIPKTTSITSKIADRDVKPDIAGITAASEDQQLTGVKKSLKEEASLEFIPWWIFAGSAVELQK